MLLFYINPKLNTETQRGEVFGQLMTDRLRLFFISKTNRKKGLRTMSRYFMYGTSLGGIEQLMMLVPNFPQRRSGIVINNYFNCQRGDRDCRMGVINIDDSCRDCISYNWNFKINLDKKRYNDLVIDCFDRIKNNF